jgi:hypothetical protein
LHFLFLGHVDDIIEVSLDLHPSLKQIFNSSSEPVAVSVRALPDVPIAKQVTFEPLSISDWEMIEMEASVLEDGGLLNQITVVYPGQILPLRLITPDRDNTTFGRIETAAWIKVVDDGECSEVLDEFSDNESNSDSSSVSCNEFVSRDYSVPCVRLMAETEVVVIPKPRIKQTTANESTDKPVNAPSKPLRIQPTMLDYPNADFELIKAHLPAPQIGHIYVHPSTAAGIPGYQQCSRDQASLGAVIIAKARSPYAQSPTCNETMDDKKYGAAIATLCLDGRVKEGHLGEYKPLK